jgi:MoaA/NifB/PqqE/SkfB family radical SAM enzyme
MVIGPDLIKAYNNTRKWYHTRHLCQAPFLNLNFEQNGNVTACCYNRDFVLGTYPKQTIHDIWFGEKIKEMREFIDNNDLGGGCTLCGLQLEAKNFNGLKAKYFDLPDQPVYKHLLERTGIYTPKYPKMMEFEISNVCNLECVMCNGYFSSSIRKNREKLPELKMVYDDAFVEQLDEFIPNLTDAKFLGGEPFMVDVYYKIWDKIKQTKPGIKIHVTTNCTHLNGRIKDLFDNLNMHIIVSIDSLVKETYETIRVNANYNRVRENVDYFINRAKEKNRNITFAICPMKNNAREIPDMVDFCSKNNIAVFFNTVWSPLSVSLRTLSKKELKSVIEHLEANKPGKGHTELLQLNYSNYMDMLNQLHEWLHIKMQYLENDSSVYLVVKYNELVHDEHESEYEHLNKEMVKYFIESHVRIHHYFITNEEIFALSGEPSGDLLAAVEKLHDGPARLRELTKDFKQEFIEVYYNALADYNDIIKTLDREVILEHKQNLLAALSSAVDYNKLLEDIINTEPDHMLESLRNFDRGKIDNILTTRYQLSTLS